MAYRAPVCFALIALIGIGHARAAPDFSAGNYTAKTVTGTHAEMAARATISRVFLDLVNGSSTDTITCSLGGTAVIGAAGMIVLPPLWAKTWEGAFIPLDAVDCISSGTSTAMAVGVH